jgi:hypothetical protein
LGNTDFGDETSAGGPLWINYLTTNYNTTPVLTYNFASGGASLPDNYSYQVKDLYQPKYTANKLWIGSNTLHLSWIGINDCSDCWLQGVNLTAISYRLGLYQSYLEEMYRTGARNAFVVNVPPLDRSPFILGGVNESAGHYKSCIDSFNGKLPNLIQDWQDKHADVSSLL